MAEISIKVDIPESLKEEFESALSKAMKELVTNVELAMAKVSEVWNEFPDVSFIVHSNPITLFLIKVMLMFAVSLKDITAPVNVNVWLVKVPDWLCAKAIEFNAESSAARIDKATTSFILGFELAGIRKTVELGLEPMKDIRKILKDPNTGILVLEEELVSQLNETDQERIERSI